jgi:hypothetical protein
MLPYVMVGLSAAWSAFVVKIVAESARVGGRTISFLGHTLLEPGEPLGVWILASFSAVAALATAASIAYMWGRRLERRMTAELDARWAEVSRRNVDLQARHAVLRRRVAELRSHVGELTDRRNALIAEVGDDGGAPGPDVDGHRSVVDLASRRPNRRIR